MHYHPAARAVGAITPTILQLLTIPRKDTGMAEYECFKVDVADFVATVRLARSPVNAQNRRFREELITIFDVLSDRPDVRAIVLTGEGKTFSAGADLKERPGLSQEIGAYPRHNRIVRESFNAVMECEKPVVAAINGAAIGAGCVLALCCDILVASEVAYLAMTEVDVGLAGGVSHVRRFFRESDARLLIYTARRMSGPELYRMGVVSECVSADALLETAQRIAHEIAAKSPSAVRAAKRSFNVTEDMPLREGYRFEQSQTVALASTEDTKEAQRAFAEKRQPVFRGG
jgi:enoyl-CoA hydratase/carnithine racemase